MQTGPSKRMGKRAVTVLCFIAAAFLVCVGSLAYISLIHGNEYKLKAEQNQLSDTTVSAQRGTIYDSNMKALAKSASAWLVYINPSKITSDEAARPCGYKSQHHARCGRRDGSQKGGAHKQRATKK